MKKLLCAICISLILAGCSLGDMDNTPTKKVERYLNNYQTLSSNVLSELDYIVSKEESLDKDQQSIYKDILKKHYQNLNYKIKEETINGDRATVEVEIEVNDYTKVLRETENYKNTNISEFMNNNVFDEFKFNEYKLNLLKNNEDKVKYTIYFSLSKVDKEWILDQLTETEQEKMLGIYEY